MIRRTLLLLATLLVAACTPAAQGLQATPTPRPTPTPPPGPDLHEALQTGAGGVGVYQLVTVPAVLVTNQSSQHAAMTVVVHFTPTRNGRSLDTVDSQAFDIPPGATVGVTGNCTDTCTGANGTAVAISIASWADPAQAPPVQVSGTAFTRGGGGGAGFGTVTAMLITQGVAQGQSVAVFAICFAGATIVGGGSTQAIWAGQGSQGTSVSVILGANPDHCSLYAAPQG